MEIGRVVLACNQCLVQHLVWMPIKAAIEAAAASGRKRVAYVCIECSYIPD